MDIRRHVGDIEPQFLAFLDQFGIAQSRGKGLAQGAEPLRRHARRDHEGAAHARAQKEEIDRPLFGVGLGQTSERRHLLHALIGRHAALQEQAARSIAKGGFAGGRVIADEGAVDLVALDGEVHFARTRIALNDAELPSKELGQHLRVGLAVGAAAGGGDDEFLAAKLRHVLDGRISAHIAHDHVAVRAAEPVELARIELNAAAAQNSLEGHAAIDDANDGAVLGGHIVDLVGRDQAAGAGHVLRHNQGLPGDVAPHVAGDQPTPQIIRPADAIADEHGHRLAAIEGFD